MNQSEKQRLLKQIATIAERAYRRGFQHGYLAASGEMGVEAPNDEQVHNWRFAQHSKQYSVCPPGTNYAYRKDKLLDRLEWELENEDMIDELLSARKTSS